MTSRNDFTRRLGTRVVTIAAAVLILAPGVALAGPAATDEYSIGPVGTGTVVGPDVQRQPHPDNPPVVDSLGVVGESAGPKSPLDAAGESVGTATWIAVSALLAGGAGLALGRFSIRRKAR